MHFIVRNAKSFKKMIYFLYGEDSYRSKEKLADIIEGYKKVHRSGLNLVYINAKEKDFDDFYANFKINSMFAEKKLIIIKDAFLNLKFQESFLDKLNDIEALKDIVIIYEDQKVDQRTKFFKALVKNTKSQEFNPLQPANLKKWILAKVEKNNSKINMEALDLLSLWIKNDLWKLSSEINKLINYKKGAVIEKKDIELHIRPDIESDIFKSIDELAAKNKKRALSLFHKHIESGDHPLYLLTMVAYQFRNLLIIKELIDKQVPYQAMAKKSGLHPFVVQKTFYAANKFSMDELKNIYKKIFLFDSKVKTGQLDPELSIDLLLSEI